MIEKLVNIKTIDNFMFEGVVKGIKAEDGGVIYTIKVTNDNNLKGQEVDISSSEIFYLALVGE